MNTCLEHLEEKKKMVWSAGIVFSEPAETSPEQAVAMLTYPETTESQSRRLPSRVLCSYVAPIFLSPMLVLSDNQEAVRYVFCACLMAVYWVLESVPFVAPSLLPLLLLPFFDIMKPDDVASGYVSEPVVSLFLGLSFALALRHFTSLYTRVAFLLLQGFGTRVRSLLLAFLGCTLLLTQVLGASLTAVLMVFIVECAIAEVQSDAIREEQFKAYAQKFRRRFSSGTGLLANRRRTRVEEPSSTSRVMHKTPADQRDRFASRILRTIALSPDDDDGCSFIVETVPMPEPRTLTMMIDNPPEKVHKTGAQATLGKRTATGGTSSSTSSPLPTEKTSLSPNAARPRPRTPAPSGSSTPGASSQTLEEKAPQVATKSAPAKGGAVGGGEKPKRRGTVHMNLDSVPYSLARKKTRPGTASTSCVEVDPSPVDSCAKKADLRDRKISIYERGKTLRPGEEDLSEEAAAEAKKMSRKKSSVYASIREFAKRRLTTSTYVDSTYLQERIAWERERYANIQKDLLIGIALTASVGSITSFHGNDSNIVLSKYYGTNGDRKELTLTRWLLITLPVVVSAVAFAWSLLMMGYLERYDADEDEDARYAINHALKHKYYEINAFSMRDFMILLMTVAWCISKFAYAYEETLTEDRVLHAPTSLLVGEALFVALFALPGEPLARWGGSSEGHASAGRLVSWSRLASTMPWGVLIVCGGVHSMLIASRVSGFSALAGNVVRRMSSFDPVTNQLVLTVAASLLTEVVSSTTTAALLVPIAVSLAEQNNAHPLYFAIPVTVASSTSLMTPVASTAITVVVAYAEIGITDLLVPGLMIKAFTVTSVLLSVNTIGEYIFNFERVFHTMPTIANHSRI